MGLYALPLSTNDHPITVQGFPELLEVTRELPFFQPTDAGLKTARSSTVGPCRGVGGMGGAI